MTSVGNMMISYISKSDHVIPGAHVNKTSSFCGAVIATDVDDSVLSGI